MNEQTKTHFAFLHLQHKLYSALKNPSQAILGDLLPSTCSLEEEKVKVSHSGGRGAGGGEGGGAGGGGGGEGDHGASLNFCNFLKKKEKEKKKSSNKVLEHFLNTRGSLILFRVSFLSLSLERNVQLIIICISKFQEGGCASQIPSEPRARQVSYRGWKADPENISAEGEQECRLSSQHFYQQD